MKDITHEWGPIFEQTIVDATGLHVVLPHSLFLVPGFVVMSPKVRIRSDKSAERWYREIRHSHRNETKDDKVENNTTMFTSGWSGRRTRDRTGNTPPSLSFVSLDIAFVQGRFQH